MSIAAYNRGSRLVAREADERMPVATSRADAQAHKDEIVRLREQVTALERALARARRCLASERAGREALRVRLADEERARAFGVGVLCRLAFPGDECVVLANAGDLKGSYALLSAHLRKDPDNVTALANLAEVLFRLGLRREAHDLFREAVNLVGRQTDPTAGTLLLMANQAAELDLVLETKEYWDRAEAVIGTEQIGRCVAEPYREKLRAVMGIFPVLAGRLPQIETELRTHNFDDTEAHAEDAEKVRLELRPLIDAAVELAERG